MKYLKYLTLFGAGILSNYGFAPYNFLPLFLISLFILMVFVFNAENKKQAFYYGYTFGFAHFAFGLSWIANALMVDSYTISTFGWLIPFFYLGAGFLFGLFFALPCLISYFGKKTLSKILLFASSFTILEICREFLLTGFPWNKLGSVFSSQLYILNSASLIGTNGLTFLILLILGIFYILLDFKKDSSSQKNYMIIVITAILGLSIYNVCYIKPIKFTDYSVKLVQSGIPQRLKWTRTELQNNFQTHLDLSKQGSPADLIIWAETSSPYDLTMSPLALSEIQKLLYDNALITGFVYNSEVGVYNAVGLIDKNSIQDIYKKSHLVPFGEYVPLKKYIPLPSVANNIYDLSSGDGIINMKHKEKTFTPLICYEGIFTKETVNKDRPDFLLIMTNDAWYGMSRGPYQHLMEARLRAIEQGVPVIRVSYNGVSAVIDSNGRILRSLDLNKSGIIDSKLPEKLSSTLYSKYTYYPLLILCGLILCITLLMNLKKKR